jgi:hypothetical protein
MSDCERGPERLERRGRASRPAAFWRLCAARGAIGGAVALLAGLGVFALVLATSSARAVRGDTGNGSRVAAGAACGAQARLHAEGCPAQRARGVRGARWPYTAAGLRARRRGRRSSWVTRTTKRKERARTGVSERSVAALARVDSARTFARRDSGSASSTCFDRKAADPKGCWVPPTGYVTANKSRAAFKPIAVPSGQSSQLPPGTISTELQGPFSSSDYLTKNGWWNEANGEFYDVYAGSLGSEPSQGVIVVFTGPLSDTQGAVKPSLRAFPSRGQDGALKITSASGWVLTLTAADGVQYRFDVKTLQYLSA